MFGFDLVIRVDAGTGVLVRVDERVTVGFVDMMVQSECKACSIRRVRVEMSRATAPTQVTCLISVSRFVDRRPFRTPGSPPWPQRRKSHRNDASLSPSQIRTNLSHSQLANDAHIASYLAVVSARYRKRANLSSVQILSSYSHFLLIVCRDHVKAFLKHLSTSLLKQTMRRNNSTSIRQPATSKPQSTITRLENRSVGVSPSLNMRTLDCLPKRRSRTRIAQPPLNLRLHRRPALPNRT
jgi:hypothetical protein